MSADASASNASSSSQDEPAPAASPPPSSAPPPPSSEAPADAGPSASPASDDRDRPRRNDLFRDRASPPRQGDAPSQDRASGASDSPDADRARPGRTGGHEAPSGDTSPDDPSPSPLPAGPDASSDPARADDPDGTDADDEPYELTDFDLDGIKDEAAEPPEESASPDAANAAPDPDVPSTSDADPSADADAPAADAAEADEADGGDAKDDDVELKVKEQIQEEKADDIEREAEVPDDIEYEGPSIDLLDAETDADPSVDMDELEENKQILLDKLDTYNIEIQDITAVVGPTVTRYELTPAPGVKVSRIKSLEDDLAMAMAAQDIRVIAPIPGKSAVGVEIPNRNRELVRLRSVLGTAKFRDTDMELPIPLGKTIEGEVFLADLTKMPHLLLAGATGSGKSVGLNALITGLIYASHPANLKFVIVDPKKIELQQYTSLENHYVAMPEDADEPVITDVEQALGVLKSCEKEMEERYDLLSQASVRGVQAYNRKFKNGDLDPDEGHRYMPYIVVVVDELADLMMTAGSDIEGPITRLAQMARAVGIHLVLATQRPSVDVITGIIKANFPSRIAYEVASRVDSRTILDQIGAEGLVGNGDMLYLSGSKLTRLQGPFVSIEEVERITEYVADQPGFGPYHLPSLQDAGHGPDVTLGVEDTDEKFEDGARVIVRRQQGSVSLLQRKLAVGYTRAARIVDQLEEAGIVGPFNGTKAREVLVDSEEELDRLLSGEDPDEADGDGDETNDSGDEDDSTDS
jgi:S-DNA-T family DNA segregation ATPase FtsK/SpoIIIE